MNALEVSLSFRGGYYFTPHFGLLVGVDGGFGELMKGCVTSGRSSSGDEDKCGAASVNVPVLAQYAFDTRRSGAYLEGGVSLFNVQLFTATKQTAVLYSTADLALGAGYHFRDSSGRALELSLHADIGQYSSASLNNDGKSASVDIASENRAFHVATTVGLGWQF
ncbi:hypothetical protein AKJ09_06057 [Labilithrix luteola]|uniref:Outer membrane protein beta-barrel domain-containing protein n=1 Tax=Labilithrix luteola TaxID=1391654 RepID=A0A0K1Q0T2_9BACT|nr:hypothetical protein AKJ09_06057 [Labilithrix luteola]